MPKPEENSFAGRRSSKVPALFASTIPAKSRVVRKPGRTKRLLTAGRGVKSRTSNVTKALKQSDRTATRRVADIGQRNNSELVR